ncbi:MAG TPA: metalloregulator ArsR/SmtB family transcription factor [Longimicrobiales bacterium]|nr:metalloregulator ArsR/SmtB family transcription factor [Longimicrobiales bacterium]
MTATSVEPRLPAGRAKLFHGLAEPSRLRILYALADGPLNVSEVVERTGLTQPNASNHLACLLGCGLVSRSREGRFSYYRHADEDVTTLLAVADRIVSDSASTILECPHCGGGV